MSLKILGYSQALKSVERYSNSVSLGIGIVSVLVWLKKNKQIILNNNN